MAKADAKAVRAAAEDAAAAAAAAAEAEAMWAAAGVGSGGGGGDNAMLFLECEVNGRQLRAFVDTGAQVYFDIRRGKPVSDYGFTSYSCSCTLAVMISLGVCCFVVLSPFCTEHLPQKSLPILSYTPSAGVSKSVFFLCFSCFLAL